MRCVLGNFVGQGVVQAESRAMSRSWAMTNCWSHEGFASIGRCSGPSGDFAVHLTNRVGVFLDGQVLLVDRQVLVGQSAALDGWSTLPDAHAHRQRAR